MGTIIGPVIGAYVLGSVLEIFYGLQEFHALFFNILLIFVVLFVPSGLIKIESKVSLMKWLKKLFSKKVVHERG
jgi:ABC-type branched-subunit amino acid transport system permease subunit